MTTQTHQEATIEMTDAELMNVLSEIDQAIGADGQFCNPSFFWSTALDPNNHELSGDAFIVLCAIASMTKHPGQGVRASHAHIAARATTIKRLLSLAHQVGWHRIMSMLGLTE